MWLRVCSINDEYEKQFQDSETDTCTDRTERQQFNLKIFIFRFDTVEKTLDGLELKWEEVRKTERGNKTSLRQLSEQPIQVQNPWPKNQLGFQGVCLLNCANALYYNSCHSLNCQASWTFLGVGKYSQTTVFIIITSLKQVFYQYLVVVIWCQLWCMSHFCCWQLRLYSALKYTV